MDNRSALSTEEKLQVLTVLGGGLLLGLVALVMVSHCNRIYSIPGPKPNGFASPEQIDEINRQRAELGYDGYFEGGYEKH